MKRLALLLLTAGLAMPAVAQEKVDLIVYGDYVLTMEEGEPVIESGGVAISGERIVAVLPRTALDERYAADRVIPGDDRVVLPGLINGHGHSAMTMFRGMVDDLGLMTWLNDYIFPMEGRFVDPAFVRTGSTLACLEMIRGGTTTFVDMYFYPDEIAGVVDRCGLRAVIAAPHIDFPSPGFKGWDDSFAAASDFVKRWSGKHPRIRPAFGPHAPYTVSPEHIAATADRAAGQTPVSMHLSEAPVEMETILAAHGRTPVAHVKAQGMLGPNLIAAHMAVLTDEDIELVAANGVGVIHNPTSNLKVGAGVARVPAMLDAGIDVGLGTDGAGSNNDLDLWEEIRLAALLHKGMSGDPTAVPARTALSMATRRGAAAIGWGNEIGQLKPGMQADLIQVTTGELHRMPLYDIVSHLVYVLDASDVTTTIVAGQVLMEDRFVTTIDEAALSRDVKALSDAISSALRAETPR